MHRYTGKEMGTEKHNLLCTQFIHTLIIVRIQCVTGANNRWWIPTKKMFGSFYKSVDPLFFLCPLLSRLACMECLCSSMSNPLNLSVQCSAGWRIGRTYDRNSHICTIYVWFFYIKITVSSMLIERIMSEVWNVPIGWLCGTLTILLNCSGWLCGWLSGYCSSHGCQIWSCRHRQGTHRAWSWQGQVS